jgi:hypothetical protein
VEDEQASLTQDGGEHAGGELLGDHRRLGSRMALHDHLIAAAYQIATSARTAAM